MSIFIHSLLNTRTIEIRSPSFHAHSDGSCCKNVAQPVSITAELIQAEQQPH